ncbi:MAG: hypothetical protein WD733_03655 [Bryobacterales bacterium]
MKRCGGMKRLMAAWLALLLGPLLAFGQEGVAGFEAPVTISGGGFFTERTAQAPRSASRFTAGTRAVVYPTVRLNENWFFAGAVQFHSRPYFYQEFETQGYGAEVDVLQGYAGYERFWGRNAVTIRAGQLSSAFGSFLLRYDDAVNPLIDIPLSYGYYTSPVTNLGLMGAQVDVTLDRFDMRAQFTNSSPANRRSVFEHDQYGVWTGGAGYTIRQGLRVGASIYRGPYLHREFQYYFPGEARPKDLPASGYGLDGEFARGHWNFRGELHRFQAAYKAIPTVNRFFGYGEAKYAFHPRWYAAVRVNHGHSNVRPDQDVLELAVGYRPNRRQLLKVGYQFVNGSPRDGAPGDVFAIQLVTNLKPISLSW